MSINYTDDGVPVSHQTRRTLTLLILINASFAVAILFAWRLVALFVVEPFSWATWMPVYRGRDLMDVIQYPFVLLWLWPAVGATGAWIGSKLGHKAFAYAIATLPISVISTIIIWYYLVPHDWH